MRIALLIAPVLIGCTSTEATSSPIDAGAPATDAIAPVTTAGPPPILEYPPGPYGTGAVGETLANFRVQGYALSPAQRDSTKLPFRDISLEEVRSKPGCACLLIVWTGAGQGCQPCVEADGAVGAGIVHDSSVCALEIVSESFDSFEWGHNRNQPAPPTRSDLDLHTQSGQQPFPVGILTDDAMSKLGAGAIPGIPTTYVVRASDMRIAGMIFGRADSLVSDARALCASPLAGVQTIASGIAPRALALDATHAYVADGSGRIVRTSRNGGTLETVATDAAGPTSITLSTAAVHWSTATTISSAPKSGGVARLLATAPSGVSYVSIASDDNLVYFTRSDGQVGSVKIADGEVATIATNEAGPKSIRVDAENVYWLDEASAEIVSAPKTGGARTSLLAPTNDRYASILLGADLVYVSELETPVIPPRVYAVPKTGGPLKLVSQIGRALGFDYDASVDVIDYVQAPYDRTPHDAAIGYFGAKPFDVSEPMPFENYQRVITVGRRWVSAIASGGDGYVYWTTNGPDGGALERMQR